MDKPKVNSIGSGQNNGALIYLVDDEPMLLELASAILAPLGYRIETFRAAKAALRAFKAAEAPPTLIITDYEMDAMTGLDLMEACRQIQPRQKFLLVSGTVGPDIFSAGPVRPVRFLAKPYQSKQLIDLVETVLAD